MKSLTTVVCKHETKVTWHYLIESNINDYKTLAC